VPRKKKHLNADLHSNYHPYGICK